MPPSIYKPLAIPTGLQGPPEGTFNTPQITFDQYDKLAAMQKAQELANSQNQLKLNEAQNAISDQDKLKAILQQQFAGLNVNDPNFDPNAGLKVATGLALQQGDMKSAMDLQKTQNSFQNSSNRVLDQAELDNINAMGGTNFGPGTTVNDVRLHIAMKNSGTQAKKVENIDRHFYDALGFKQSMASAPGLFDAMPDANGKPTPLTPKQIDNLKGLQTLTDIVIRNGDAYINDVSNNRYPIGDARVKQEQAIANMLPALRRLDNQGVKFNEFIKGIDVQQMGDDPGLAHRIAGTFTGQDPAAAIDRFIRDVVKQAQIQINGNRGYLSKEKVANYDPELVPLWEKYGMFDRGQPVNKEDISGAMGRAGAGQAPAADSVTPEERAWIENYKKNKMQQGF